MANLLDILEKKGKDVNLSIQGTTPVKYDNPIARLNQGAASQRDPKVSLNTNAVSKAQASTPPRA
ncbi:MAG: hypothetical protein EBZ49_01260 [Proteobacteria bacterium]|nr:hypothetical protein [Pseudomonadota bacterium]